MGTAIFNANQIGQVIKLDGPIIAGNIQRSRLVSIDAGAGQGKGLGEDFTGFKCIITGVSINGAANVQFQHTFGDTVYLNVFGDRISQMKIAGIAVSDICDANDGEHGISKLIKYYQASKVSSRADPMTITLGSTAVKGYLVGFQAGLFGEQQTIHRLFQFGLDFVVPPDNVGGGFIGDINRPNGNLV